MSKLLTYNAKRDFELTDEPQASPQADKKAKQKVKPRFVVQRHHASRLHYDFRLEVDGVLKSWAVPKGPSLYPQDKRLAVQVEDHPLSYADFEGTIAKGNYGAGTVTIFDEGYFEFLDGQTEKQFLGDLKKGSLKFRLDGKKLQGEFALVRMKSAEEDKAWLLIKHKDEYAVDAAYDAEDEVAKEAKEEGEEFKKKTVAKRTSAKDKKADKTQSAKAEPIQIPAPMLAKLAEAAPEDEEWLFEQKYDGFRVLAVRESDKVSLYSRNGKILNKLFPSIVKQLRGFRRNLCLDGEVVIEDAQGAPKFQLLASGEPIPASLSLHYYLFDLLRLDGNDLTSYPLSERKELLSLLMKDRKPDLLVLVSSLKGSFERVFKEAQKQSWEGLIAKDPQSSYLAGGRNGSWLKIKFRQSQEAVICGFTKPKGSRKHFGALVLGYYADSQWLYLGNCGTGFTDDILAELYEQLAPLAVSTKPFAADVSIAKEKEVTWVSRQLVCEVYYSEFTADHHLRHPVYKGLRTDKAAKDVEMEKKIKSQLKERTVKLGKHAVKLTNLDKVYWPAAGYTKGDMLDYYEKYGDLLLPYLKDKPLSLHRFPNGITEKGFFQKDMELDQLPKWAKTTKVYAESSNRTIDYLICNNKATLLYVANLGSIEINPWLSTYKKVEKPDFAVLDIDPNGADFKEVVRVAQTAHKLFKQAGVADYIKTSGSTGLHIYLYVKGKYSYEVVRDFIQLIAELLHGQHPDTTSLVRDPKKRKGLIYLDFLQNRRGQTIAAPYSVRPMPGATISIPLFWNEVNDDLSVEQFTLETVPARLDSKSDPWSGIFDMPSDIKQALQYF